MVAHHNLIPFPYLGARIASLGAGPTLSIARKQLTVVAAYLLFTLITAFPETLMTSLASQLLWAVCLRAKQCLHASVM